MTFNELLDKNRDLAYSERDKGERFEMLMQAYLQTDPRYAHNFENVWMWRDFFGRYDLSGSGSDTGIDLVAKTHAGEFWAIQCKFYQEDASIDKASVDSFLATSGRSFIDENNTKKRFSNRLWISTTNKWTNNATDTIKNQEPPVSRLNLSDLQEAPVDWEKLYRGLTGEQSRTIKNTLRPHQQEALEKTHEYFKTQDRGKLIMACGTGKTFNSLRIAEHETNGKGFILFLVPSISLLGQTLKEWTAHANEAINAVCICSDPQVSKSKTKCTTIDSYSVVDLALPASTNVDTIIRQFESIKASSKTSSKISAKTKTQKGMTVVFSTYQSIDVIAKAQKELAKIDSEFSEFDLIICDEAHRTTGFKTKDEDFSAFIKVHDNDFIKAKKRLYMTATPRLFSDDAKSKAAESDTILCSMDDEKIYGKEMYRIGFGEAVEKDLLTDYKVLILTLDDKDISSSIQDMIADKENNITIDDASKLIGCINALSKQILGDDGVLKTTDPEPMKRAVAFCQTIANSKKITDIFNTAADTYINSLSEDKKTQMVSLESQHIDGAMNAPDRDALLSWLKSPSETNECKVLTNVRCLSEGVDVPSLDAVMFLSARNSQVDVVQSVGRVMRKAPGKKYGYIIIPVLIPTNVEAHKAMDNNERYKVVWSVLNALRAHDDRFNAIINKIDLNKKRPSQILIGRPDDKGFDSEMGTEVDTANETPNQKESDVYKQISLGFEEIQNLVFARMVQKVGDRRYWEQWAKSVAEIAERQVERISRLIQEDGKHKDAFEKFLAGLQKNINPSINQQEAIDMLSQHLITKPVFEALFESYSFVQHNPISLSMQKMIDLLEEQAIEKDTETLAKFYESVKMRASGIDNAEGKQRIIIELYDKFFKTAFPKMVEKLGIVYTPVEVVDFIIHSVNDILQKEFYRSLTDENIHIIDPFTGTGTFITRLLQSGLIEKKDLERKYTKELHANEIVLLAYYIAAVNIENAYHDAMELHDYHSFDGICLTDTFQLGETDDGEKLFSEMFPQNSERVANQKKAPVRVIIGNPPYSVGQKSANDNAQNQEYPNLDQRIAETYAKSTKATNKNSLYDSYIKAFRWSSDRLDKDGGIICFVSNGAWLDSNSSDGFRKEIEKEFSSIYVFNLRGNQRTSGELSRKEGGKIFGGGSRTPIAITLLVKNPFNKTNKAEIFYYDIGDYLSQAEKLKQIVDFKSMKNIPLKRLKPNKHGDWINKRNDSFEEFIPIAPEKKFDAKSQSIFIVNSRGLETSRDSWVYNSSRSVLNKNMNSLVSFYNSEVERFAEAKMLNPKVKSSDFINSDATKISWSSSLIPKLEKGEKAIFEKDKIGLGVYRPFFKQYLYRGDKMIHRRGQFEEFFPKPNSKNLLICLPGIGSKITFSTLITNKIPDLGFFAATQCFPLYYYEEIKNDEQDLFSDISTDAISEKYIRRDGVSDFILHRAKKQYGLSASSKTNISKEDIFYYVYGFLHSKEYRKKFANDLKKMLPRLPLVDDIKDFWAFSKAGRSLAELHLNYETIPAYENAKVIGRESEYYEVTKMRFPKKDHKDSIIYNSKIKIENIPAKAYDYIVNGKSAIEWIMERYQITTHKESGITNNPNDWSKEVNKPSYILDLLLSIINVSLQTVDIVESLPKVDFDQVGKESTFEAKHI